MTFQYLEFAKLGEENFNQEKYEEAITYYNKAIELSPQTATFYNYRADAYRKLHMYDNAIKDYNKTVELGDPEAYNGRGLIKYYIKDYKGAIEDYSKFLSIANECYGYDNRGDAKKQIKDYDGAIDDYWEAFGSYWTYGAYEKTIKICMKIIELIPNDPDVYYAMANAKYELKDYYSAIENYKKAFDLCSDNKDLKNEIKEKIEELKQKINEQNK